VCRFNLSRHEVIGAPALVAEGLSSERTSIDFTTSRTGALAYVTGAGGADREAIWVGRAGAVQRVDSNWRAPNLRDPAISPDGSRFLASTGGALSTGSSDILVKRFDAAAPPSKLTLEGGINRFPVWTRDGKNVVYARSSGDSSSVVERAVDGGPPP